jgi:hypothetical protein
MDAIEQQLGIVASVPIESHIAVLRTLRMMLERFRLSAKDCGVWPGEPASVSVDNRDFDDLWMWIVAIGDACAKFPVDHFLDRHGWKWWAVDSDRMVERLVELVGRIRTAWGADDPKLGSPDHGLRARVYFCVPVGTFLPTQTYGQQLTDEPDEPIIVDVIARPLDAQHAATIERCLARLEIVIREAELDIGGDSHDVPSTIGRPPDPITQRIAAFIRANRKEMLPWADMSEAVLKAFGRKLSESTLKCYYHRYKASG